MPLGVTNKDLAYRFNNFFIDKITKIRNDLIGKQQHLPLYVETPAPLNTNKLCRFQPITLSQSSEDNSINTKQKLWSRSHSNKLTKTDSTIYSYHNSLYY